MEPLGRSDTQHGTEAQESFVGQGTGEGAAVVDTAVGAWVGEAGAEVAREAVARAAVARAVVAWAAEAPAAVATVAVAVATERREIQSWRWAG